MTKPETRSKQQPAASPTPTGGDATLSLMRKAQIPVTRENYLQIAYFGRTPQPWTIEHELELPKELQDPKVLSGASAPSKEEIPEVYREIQKRYGMSDEEILDWMDVT